MTPEQKTRLHAFTPEAIEAMAAESRARHQLRVAELTAELTAPLAAE